MLQKGSKGRMTISLLPRAASRTPRPVGGAGSKEWQRASPAPSEEKPLASAKSSSGFSTTSNTALESNSRISKSPLVWASLPSPMTKKPVFLSRSEILCNFFVRSHNKYQRFLKFISLTKFINLFINLINVTGSETKEDVAAQCLRLKFFIYSASAYECGWPVLSLTV